MVKIQNNHFSLNQIADSGQCFRWFKVSDNCYDIVAFDKVLRATQDKNIIYFDCSQEDFDHIWYFYFNLDIDYPQPDCYDMFLSAAYEYGSGIRILWQNLWETTVSFIISQRKSIPAIKTSIERLCRAYGNKIEGTKYYTFPKPYQLTTFDKDDCGLGYRLPYIKDLAQKVIKEAISPELVDALEYDEAKKLLLSVRGIGEKVANCILLFGLGHIKACPIDVWVQRIIDEEYNGLKPNWMNSPYAGYYQQLTFFYKRHLTK